MYLFGRISTSESGAPELDFVRWWCDAVCLHMMIPAWVVSVRGEGSHRMTWSRLPPPSRLQACDIVKNLSAHKIASANNYNLKLP